MKNSYHKNFHQRDNGIRKLQWTTSKESTRGNKDFERGKVKNNPLCNIMNEAKAYGKEREK